MQGRRYIQASARMSSPTLKLAGHRNIYAQKARHTRLLFEHRGSRDLEILTLTVIVSLANGSDGFITGRCNSAYNGSVTSVVLKSPQTQLDCAPHNG